MSRYKGRHRKPSYTAQKTATVAVAGAIAALGAGTGTAFASPAVPSAPPGGWGPIISCESGGSPTAHNPNSTASGLFQFVNSTWAHYGGTEFAPTAAQATAAEQYIVAERAYAASGTSPWNASKGCWDDGHVSVHPPRKPVAKPKHQLHAAAPIEQYQALPAVARPTLGTEGNYTVKPGDTLIGIARAHGTDWMTIESKNKHVIEDEDWIFPGENINI
jgi:nucleoid-associated protein YgaU